MEKFATFEEWKANKEHIWKTCRYELHDKYGIIIAIQDKPSLIFWIKFWFEHMRQ